MDRDQATTEATTQTTATASLLTNSAFLAELVADPVVAIAEEHLARFAISGAGAGPVRDVSRSGRVAIIPIAGVLMPRGGRYSFGQGMDSLRAQIRAAADDPDVAAIVLDVDSPGGTVAGSVETAAEVRAAAEKKRVVAVANPSIGSAAYWIASQASELAVSPMGDVGSIGVYAMHVDASQAFKAAGLDVTLVRSGKYKAEGSPFAPLTDEAKAYMQSRVDEAHTAFIRDVAQGRKVAQAKVRSEFGEGRMVGAEQAVARGLADRVATLDQVIAGLVGRSSSASSSGAPLRRRSALAFA